MFYISGLIIGALAGLAVMAFMNGSSKGDRNGRGGPRCA